MAINILIDSASDINATEAKQMGIDMIPLEVSFGDEHHLDGVNLLPHEFYDKLVSYPVLPTTSLINEYRFNEVFEKLTKNGDELIVIVLSSKLSGTYNSAVSASEKYNDKVHVIDSLTAAIGERMLAIQAIELIKEGKSATEVENILNELKLKLHIFAVIDTLKYLKKGGRISATVAFAGELMNIKPLVTIADGEVKIVGKVIGTKKAISAINNKIKENGGINTTLPYGYIYSGNDMTNFNKYLELSKIDLKKDNIPCYPLGGTIGTHVGPGSYGIAFFEN